MQHATEARDAHTGHTTAAVQVGAGDIGLVRGEAGDAHRCRTGHGVVAGRPVGRRRARQAPPDRSSDMPRTRSSPSRCPAAPAEPDAMTRRVGMAVMLGGPVYSAATGAVANTSVEVCGPAQFGETP